MESSVENRHLGNATHKLFDDFHPFQFGAIMQRRKRRSFGNPGPDLRRDQNWLLVFWTAMDHAMPYDIHFGQRRQYSSGAVRQAGKQMLQSWHS